MHAPPGKLYACPAKDQDQDQERGMSNTVSVEVWRKDMREDEQLDASRNLQIEATNLLKYVGLEYCPPKGAFSGKDFHAVPLLNEARFSSEYFGSERMQSCKVDFDAKDGCFGMCFFFANHGAKLVVRKITAAGRVAQDQRMPKAPKVVKADDQWEYTIGQMYGGTGFFSDPDDPLAESTGPARKFLTPLCGLAISVQFHPASKQLALENSRFYPIIMAYRVDGLFCTSFSASWQVIYRF
jgi:hypothetical protein